MEGLIIVEGFYDGPRSIKFIMMDKDGLENISNWKK
jgi:hypothetical protein